MEFNTISVSDGVTMGTEGMRGSLVSREVIADSIELVARSHGFDAVVCLVACDKTGPAAAMALARLERPGLIFYTGSIAPGPAQRQRRHRDGRVRGHRRAHRRHALERGAAPARERRVPGRRRLRRPVHRQHDGDGARVPRALADGAGRHPGDAHDEGRGRRRDRPHDHGSRRARRARLRPDHARIARERARERRRLRRLDERRDAPDRDRARARDPAHARGRRPRDEADADRREPAAGRQVQRHRPVRGGRLPLVARRARAAGSAARRRDDGHRAHDRRARGERPPTPGQQVVVSIAEPIKPNGGLAVLGATSRRRAA